MKDRDNMDRRIFLKYGGAAVVVAGFGGKVVLASEVEGPDGIPVCEGYLVVDTKKCQGCLTCMVACSLANHGRANLSLARIQIIQNPFEGFPDDLTVEACRQCVEPECVAQCSTGALHVDTENGNVRRVNKEECTGCQACVLSCPHMPSSAIFNHEEEMSAKCDLCTTAPHWKKGGTKGVQACVAVCPVGAIQFTDKVPTQEDDSGYKVNLRDENWGKLGYPTD